MSELALRPAGFVEVLNASGATVDAPDYRLRAAPRAWRSGASCCPRRRAALLAWPGRSATRSRPGERLVRPGEREARRPTSSALPEFEGAATIWHEDTTGAERSRRRSWPGPPGASLARVPDESGAPRFCGSRALRRRRKRRRASSSSGRELPQAGARTRAGHERRLRRRWPKAARRSASAAVKFVVDMQARRRGAPAGQPRVGAPLQLDSRADSGRAAPRSLRPRASREFNLGWGLFSQTEYFQVEGRRYLLGTLVRAHQRHQDRRVHARRRRSSARRCGARSSR